MFLLAATCSPPPAVAEPVAASRRRLSKFLGVRRRIPTGETLYMPAHCASTLIAQRPKFGPIVEPVVEPIEDDYDLLLRDIRQDVINKQNVIRLLDAALAFNQGKPFDAIFLKGLAPNVC